MKHHLHGLLLAILALTMIACHNKKQATETTDLTPVLVGPTFSGDTALALCAVQCDFGPRTMNSEAHDKCEKWIIEQFRKYGCEVTTQKADLKGWDGQTLRSTNIIASINPQAERHILICAHWDCRPWADNDPDSTNWRKPVLAANDAASGVAVMLEMARVIQGAAAADSTAADTIVMLSKNVGIDFVCFDAEDYGAPDWSGLEGQAAEDSWALGAQYFAKHPAHSYECGILLDMVGGQGARFYQEGVSMHYAQNVMEEMWQAAYSAGFGDYFINQPGGHITDDHKPLNEAGIPTIDIISYFPGGGGFGPTWHTVQDDMQHMDKDVLKAVGQSVIQFLFTHYKE